MIDNHKVIAIVPARGGSKSIVDKNLQPLGKRPLLAWPIEHAKKSQYIDRVIVSTDCDKIANCALQFDSEVYERPEELATDEALVIDCIKHLFNTLSQEGEKADIFVLLEPTSPFRSEEMIDKCIYRLQTENLDSIATFNEASTNPERAWKIRQGCPEPFLNDAVPWKPRQKLEPAYALNGAVYAFRPEKLPENGPELLFGHTGAEIISNDILTLDIDTEKDLRIANAILETA